MQLKLKILDIRSDVPAQIEEETNSWLADKDFNTLEIQHIIEYDSPKVGTRVYIIYEEAGENDLAEKPIDR